MKYLLFFSSSQVVQNTRHASVLIEFMHDRIANPLVLESEETGKAVDVERKIVNFRVSVDCKFTELLKPVNVTGNFDQVVVAES